VAPHRNVGKEVIEVAACIRMKSTGNSESFITKHFSRSGFGLVNLSLTEGEVKLVLKCFSHWALS
jgi:hypothetical protein